MEQWPVIALGICEAVKDLSGVSSKKREKKEHLEEWRGGVTGLNMLLRRIQPPVM